MATDKMVMPREEMELLVNPIRIKAIGARSFSMRPSFWKASRGSGAELGFVDRSLVGGLAFMILGRWPIERGHCDKMIGAKKERREAPITAPAAGLMAKEALAGPGAGAS
ncbi:hypothetical protein BHM03_00059732, partial [Ensete ventricosum]